jgi:hypothetical protein
MTKKRPKFVTVLVDPLIDFIRVSLAAGPVAICVFAADRTMRQIRMRHSRDCRSVTKVLQWPTNSVEPL